MGYLHGEQDMIQICNLQKWQTKKCSKNLELRVLLCHFCYNEKKKVLVIYLIWTLFPLAGAGAVLNSWARGRVQWWWRSVLNNRVLSQWRARSLQLTSHHLPWVTPLLWMEKPKDQCCGRWRELVQLLQCQFKNILLLKYSAKAQWQWLGMESIFHLSGCSRSDSQSRERSVYKDDEIWS